MSWMSAASIRIQIQRYERLLKDAQGDSRDLGADLAKLREARDQHQRVTNAMESNLSGCMQGFGCVTIDRARVRSAATFLDQLRTTLSKGDTIIQDRREHWRQLVSHIETKEDKLKASQSAEGRYSEKLRELRQDLRIAEATGGAF